jgi:RHS repeat-associated protein
MKTSNASTPRNFSKRKVDSPYKFLGLVALTLVCATANQASADWYYYNSNVGLVKCPDDYPWLDPEGLWCWAEDNPSEGGHHFFSDEEMFCSSWYASLDPFGGVNRFGIRSGNAQRAIRDLPAANGNRLKLEWARHHNTRDVRSTSFGSGGSWRHSWQFDLEEIPATGGAQPELHLTFPTGSTRRFVAAGPDRWTDQTDPGFTVAANTDELCYQTPDNQSFFFSRSASATGRPAAYRLVRASTSTGDKVILGYDGIGALTSVNDTAGRSLEISWRSIPVTRGHGAAQITQNVSVISEVRDWAGRTVQYGYEVLSEESSGASDVILTKASYSDGAVAHYTYSRPRVGGKALLASADDPRYPGVARRIGYSYQTATDTPEGMIHQEHNLATGHPFVTLTLDPADPARRTLDYSDFKFTHYRVAPEGEAGEAERVDSLGRTNRAHYDASGHILADIDHRGLRTEYHRDTAGRVVSELRTGKPERTFAYDAEGRRIAASDDLGRQTTLERDNAGRLTRRRLPDGRTEETTYDTQGRIASRKKPDGSYESFARDNLGRVISITDATGATRRRGYDALDRLVEEIDAFGRVTRHTYNEIGLRTKTILPDGRSQSFSYDIYGRKTAETDSLARTATWSYDELSRVIRRTDFIGLATTYEYSEFPNGCSSCTLSDRPTRIVGPDGAVTTFLYDSEGRLLARTVASGTSAEATAIYAYDNDDNIVSVTDPIGRVTRHTYDDEHHRLTTTDPLGRVIKMAYDEHYNLASVTASDSTVIRHTYDFADRRTATTDALGQTTRFAYDDVGRMTSLTDARRSVYRWEYDATGRKTAMIYPDNSRETWTYDIGGRIITSTTRASQMKTFSYDAQGRLVAEVWADHAAPDSRYTYTTLGQLATLDNGVAAVIYTYDAVGRVTSETSTRAGQAPLTVGQGYDASTGRRATLTYPSGAVASQTYSPRGEIASLSLDGASAATFGYDLAGQRTTTLRANGVKTTDTTDAAGQLLAVLHTLDTTTLASTHYELDTAGRRVAKTDESGWTEHYGYDATGQLTNVDYLESPAARQSTRRVDYAYDALGNRERLAEVDRAQQGPGRNTTTHYTANNLNQYTRLMIDSVADTPTYNANGNLTRAQGVEYRYNAKNQLVEVTTATARMTQVHDPKGRVIERRYFTRGSQAQWMEDAARSLRLVYDPAWNVIEDRGLGDELRARYVHGPRVDEILRADLLTADRSQLTSHYPLADGLGSTAALTDATGRVTQRFRADAYGAPTALSPDFRPLSSEAAFRFLFTGREWLGIAGLQDNRYRVYSAILGRWLQADPIHFQAKDHSLLRYVFNDPISLTDAFGLICGCTNAPALFSFSSACDAYGNETYLGTSLRCFCKCAGDDPWSMSVRGCLACEHSAGTNPFYAHLRRYDSAGILTSPLLTLGECYITCLAL